MKNEKGLQFFFRNFFRKPFVKQEYEKVEGINLQDEEFDPGGPLFQRKKNKSQKGIPAEGVTPPYFFGLNYILEKKI